MRINLYLFIQILLLIFSCVLRIYNDDWLYKFDVSTATTFLNVGNGDSILTRLPHGAVLLVDFGTDNSVSYYLGRMLPFDKKQIDYAVLSHPHADHMGSIKSILNEYKIGCFIYDDSYKEVNLIEKDLRITTRSMNTFRPENAKDIGEICHMQKTLNILTYYYGNKFSVSESTKNPNLRSIILVLQHDRQNVFLFGDAESSVQSYLFEDLISSKIPYAVLNNIIKVPHQGSKDAINRPLMNFLLPKVAVFSVGKNSYGHPHKETLDFYGGLSVANKTSKTDIFRTDKSGNITIMLNNDTYYVK